MKFYTKPYSIFYSETVLTFWISLVYTVRSHYVYMFRPYTVIFMPVENIFCYYPTGWLLSNSYLVRISSYVTLTFTVNEMGSHWLLTLLYRNNKNVLYWPEDDRLRSKYVAVIWPDCIHNITVLIYCCVLTEYNTLYKTLSLLLLGGNGNSSSLFVSSLTLRQIFSSSPGL